MTFRFTAGWAHVLVALGIVAIVVGVLLAAAVAAVPLPWTDQKLGTIERIAVGAMLVAAGIAVGGSLVATGQLMLAFLNVRENLEQLTARLAGSGEVACPYCGEEIKAEASICRYCRSDLTRPTAADRFLAPR